MSFATIVRSFKSLQCICSCKSGSGSYFRIFHFAFNLPPVNGHCLDACVKCEKNFSIYFAFYNRPALMQCTLCICGSASNVVKTPIQHCTTVNKSSVVNCVINEYHWHCALKLISNLCVIALDALA